MTRAAVKQVEIGGLDTEEEEKREIEAGYRWREALWSEMRLFVETYVDAENGMKKYDGCAFRLNKRWEKKGRPVTPGALKNALEDANRNNFRAEWLDWFCSQSPEIAEINARRVKPTKTADARLADIVTVMRKYLAPKLVDMIQREADNL